MTPTRTYPVQKLVNGRWGYSYNQEEGMMLGGFSEDGKTFTHTFTLYEVEKKDVMFAVALCGLLYGEKDTVETSYRRLIGDDDSTWRLFRYDVELHNK